MPLVIASALKMQWKYKVTSIERRQLQRALKLTVLTAVLRFTYYYYYSTIY